MFLIKSLYVISSVILFLLILISSINIMNKVDENGKKINDLTLKLVIIPLLLYPIAVILLVIFSV